MQRSKGINMPNIKGKCNICGNNVDFIDVDPSRLRESFRCPVCDSSSRNRLLIYSLGLFFGLSIEKLISSNPHKDIKIFEASGVSKYVTYLSKSFDYINTKYDSDELKKADFDHERYADLQNLHFDNDSFHVVITADVLEHVRLYEAALKEIYRVLKPEGIFLLQIPYNHSREETITRVEIAGDEDIHLLPPVYHGGHTLVYRDYGRDLLQLVRDIGFTVVYFEIELLHYGIPRQYMIIGSKAPYFNMTPVFTHSPVKASGGISKIINSFSYNLTKRLRDRFR